MLLIPGGGGGRRRDTIMRTNTEFRSMALQPLV